MNDPTIFKNHVHTETMDFYNNLKDREEGDYVIDLQGILETKGFKHKKVIANANPSFKNSKAL